MAKDTLNQLLSAEDIKGPMDYIRLARKIDQSAGLEELSVLTRVKIAILSSFNVGGIRETLLVKSVQAGFFPEIYVGGYNQYNQEILDPNSHLYQFRPDLVFLLVDTLTVAGETYLQPYSFTDDDRKRWVKLTLESTLSLIAVLKSHSNAKIVIHNFEIPTHSPLGILEVKQSYGFRQSIEELNSRLANALKTDDRALVFDFECFVSRVGKDRTFNPKMYYLGDMRISPQVIPALCDLYLPYIRGLLSKTKKALVLDLDNVLWGGIVGEDGIEGIRLGPTPEGRPFMELQQYILSLYDRGVILAINSANNEDDVLEVLREHPHMILKENHFAAMRINWENKVSNLRSIADELEIGVDSLVFVDDSKLNRDMIRHEVPDVLTVELPDDPALYLRTIQQLTVFDSLQYTPEDRARGRMYAEQRKRQEFRRAASDISDYLKSLESVVTIAKANNLSIPRISQLTQRTNQFNVTAKRYSVDDIARLSESNHYLVLALSVHDRFGDSGLTGVAIVEKRMDKWRIDSFLLSCRVLGRKVEDAFLAFVIDQARSAGAKSLVGEFIPTKKNVPAKRFYPDHGFIQVSDSNGIETWEKQLQETYPFPRFIRVVAG